MKHVTPGNRHDPVKPAPAAPRVRPRITVRIRLASEAARLAYLREGVMCQIKQNAPVNIVGRQHYTLAQDSATRWVLGDETRDWTMSAQRTSFHKEGRPTIETILNRPLNGATMIPLGTPYPWDLDKQSGADTRYCSIDMVYFMAMRRTRHKGTHAYKHCVLGWQASNTACEQVRKEIYPAAREYPYGEEGEDDYMGRLHR